MKKIVFAAACVMGLSASMFASSDANACGMSVRLEQLDVRPTPVQEIASAERALESGNNVNAATIVARTFPSFRSINAGDDPLKTRALRVMALAIVRTNGDTARAGGWTPSANLDWAVQSLKEIDAKRPNDPSVQADLGEAMAKVPSKQADALAILSKLADKDLMGSPNAYAALAKLRSEKGDVAGSAQAIKRCEEMTKNPGVCRQPNPTQPTRPNTTTVAVKA
jgi:hypothetical protein